MTCPRCLSAEVERDRALALVSDTQTPLDAERRHGADLEARLLRHAPTWEVEA